LGGGGYVFGSLVVVFFGVHGLVMFLGTGVFLVHVGYFVFYDRRVGRTGAAVHFLDSSGSYTRLVVHGAVASSVS